MTSNIIAWLVPTTPGSSADKATKLVDNTLFTVPVSSHKRLSSRITDLVGGKPQRGIQLSFDQQTRQPGRFTFGTDPALCDVLLPPMPHISSQHCSITFDSESRLVLNDFSEHGTQVWYDWDCCGDQTDYTWVLSSGQHSEVFQSNVSRVVMDIQGARFQVILNEQSDDWPAFQGKVEAFCELPTCLDIAVEPLLFLFQHVAVKGYGGTACEVYIWNLARPWEPMVKAAA